MKYILFCFFVFSYTKGRASWGELLQSEGPAGGSDREDAGEKVRPGTAHTGTGDSRRVTRNIVLFLPGLFAVSLSALCLLGCVCMLTCQCTFISSTPFYQELVSVGTDGRTGDLSVLGTVKHKMVCSPDFEALLENLAWSRLNMAVQRLHELSLPFSHNHIHSICILCFCS